MASRLVSVVTQLAWLCLFPAGGVSAQAPATDTSQNSIYTVQTDTRIVLTDVTVTDEYGNPVPGLTASDFTLLDNGKPQALSSFEEHVATGTGLTATPDETKNPGVYSNDFMQHLPPVLNILLVDVRRTGFPSLGYLQYELNRFIRQLPSDEPVAVYVRASDVVMLQSFTADHALLLAAVRKAVDRFALRSDSYPSDSVTLHTIASDIGPLPGRKHVLWFAGYSDLKLNDDGPVYEDDAELRQVYDELQAARVVVYPIDADGVSPYDGFGARQNKINNAYESHVATHDRMKQTAQATGGRAAYNDNGLDAIASRIVSSDGNYYTLSYSPPGAQFDGKWHKIEVMLPGRPKLDLSYRHGYFADDIQDRSGAGRFGRVPGRRLLNGSGPDLAERPDPWSVPIIFDVTVLPAADHGLDELPAQNVLPSPAQKKRRRSIPYVIRYSLPASEVTVTTTNGTARAEIGVSLIAVDHYGNIVAREADHVTLTRSVSDLHSDPDKPILVEQRVRLTKGATDLYCAAWDMTSHRLGSLEVPLKVTGHTPETASARQP